MSCEGKNCFVLKSEKFQGVSKKEVIYMGRAYFSMLYIVEHWRYYLLVIHLLLFREVHVHYV